LAAIDLIAVPADLSAAHNIKKSCVCTASPACGPASCNGKIQPEAVELLVAWNVVDRSRHALEDDA